MFVTNVTVLRGDRGLTEVTPYDILEALIHGRAKVGHYIVVRDAGKLKRNINLT